GYDIGEKVVEIPHQRSDKDRGLC
ncbi:uncharacterized protein METZ01_LOCUS303834, partial [marine metagenome]